MVFCQSAYHLVLGHFSFNSVLIGLIIVAKKARWMIGELHVIDPEIIVNSRRDGFEKNSAYYELLSNLKDWAFEISKEIRHLSYERSLFSPKKAVVEAE